MAALNSDDDFNFAQQETRDTEPNVQDRRPSKLDSDLDLESFYFDEEAGKESTTSNLQVDKVKAAVKIMRSSAKAFAKGDLLDRQISRILR